MGKINVALCLLAVNFAAGKFEDCEGPCPVEKWIQRLSNPKFDCGEFPEKETLGETEDENVILQVVNCDEKDARFDYSLQVRDICFVLPLTKEQQHRVISVILNKLIKRENYIYYVCNLLNLLEPLHLNTYMFLLLICSDPAS